MLWCLLGWARSRALSFSHYQPSPADDGVLFDFTKVSIDDRGATRKFLLKFHPKVR
jgi:hypothetical protein